MSLDKCPNCGAWVNGCRCGYCGTSFFDEDALQNELERLESKQRELEMSLIINKAFTSIKYPVLHPPISVKY